MTELKMPTALPRRRSSVTSMSSADIAGYSQPGAGAERGGPDVAHVPAHRERAARDDGGRREEPREPEAADHELAEERGERGGDEARQPEDAEGPAPPLDRHHLHHVDVVGDEERGEGHPLQHAQRAQERQRARHHEEGAGDHQEPDPEAHEEPPPEVVDEGADHRLAHDAGRAVEALHEPDVRLVAAELLDVQRQQQEPVEGAEEEKVGEHDPRERTMSQEFGGGAGHPRCGRIHRGRRMTGDMNAREYSTWSRAGRTAQTVPQGMAAAPRLAPDGRGRLLAPPPLQSWPGIVHGGGLVALLDAAARALGA